MLRTLFIGILILSCSASYGQVPNAGFENWNTDDSGKTYPEGWNAMPKDSITQTSDAFRDSSAARIKPNNGFEITPSILSNGFQAWVTPTRFSCYVKTQIPDDDTVYLQVDLYNNDTLTARKNWTATETISTYQRVNLEFDDVDVRSDSFFVSFQSGCCAETGGADPQTTLMVDEMGFYTAIDAIEDSKKTEPVEIFPNPVSKTFQIKGLRSSNSYQYQLYNNLGQVAKSGTFKENNPQINLNGLPSGIYQLFLENENNGTVKSTKVVKQ